MKAITVLLSFMFVSSCVTSGVKNRSVASESCNIENYLDFINKEGVHSCNLQGADFYFANLPGVNLQGANLKDATFTFANLQEVNLKEANLDSTGFGSADLRGADLRGAIFQWTYFQQADLRGADLRGTRLSGAVLQNTKGRSRANLNNAKVTKDQAENLKSRGFSGFVIVE